MRYLMILTGAVCLALMTCAPPPQESAEPPAREAPSTEADVEAIKAVNQQCLTAIKAGDADTIASLCADDHIWIPANEAELIGKDAFRESLQAVFDQFEYDESWSSEEVVVFGDWAFDRGTFTATLTPKDGGEPLQDEGRYIWILKRQADGSWKYARSMWNRGSPPAEEPPT